MGLFDRMYVCTAMLNYVRYAILMTLVIPWYPCKPMLAGRANIKYYQFTITIEGLTGRVSFQTIKLAIRILGIHTVNVNVFVSQE